MSELDAIQSALGKSAPAPGGMSPHDPSLFSLLNAFFEPNFLILVLYLCINLYLAFRVIKIATRKYRQLRMLPKEYGEMGLVQVPIDGEDVMSAHQALFRIGGKPKKVKTDTPAADALIKIATWALKDKARRAKLVITMLAVLSLASTWYYMLSFLRHSYLAYLERCHLTSFPLPPTPPPIDLRRPGLLVPALHLRILRISQWLGSLSLFKEAWMEVIKDASSWWWSSEICIITVGAWALFLRHEAERLRIPHVWTFMALGQLVAISFAFNLFNLAVIYRLEASDFIAARSDTTFKARDRVFKPLEEDEDDSPPRISPQPEYERLREERGGYRVVVSAPRRAGRSPLASPSAFLPPSPSDSPDSNVRRFSTTITIKKTPLPPQPTMMDKVGRILQEWIPEKFGMPVFIIAGLSSVLQHPNSFTKVMVMHVFPLLVSLYAAYRLPRASTVKRPSNASRWRPSTPHLTTRRILKKMLSRSKLRVPLWRDDKMYYLALGAISIVLRLWLTLACFWEVDGSSTISRRVFSTIGLLFPTTFFQHPAQSSISSDHVCVALSASIYVLLESGLWLWKAAAASPSAVFPSASDPDEDEEVDPDSMVQLPLPTSLRLDRADRHVIETQARVVVVLLALSPLLGGSATLSLYLAARCTWIEQHDRHRNAVEDDILSPPEREGAAVVIEDREEITVVENEEGERYMEVRNIKVKELPGLGDAHPQPVNPIPHPMEEEADLLTPSSTSTFVLEGSPSDDDHSGSQGTHRRQRRARRATAESEAGSEAGRRTTPLRHRHPPQRFGEPVSLSSPR